MAKWIYLVEIIILNIILEQYGLCASSNWTPYGTMSYKVVMKITTYTNASQSCVGEGGTLASICNKPEENWLLDLIKKETKSDQASIWIGYTCQGNCKNDSNWKWTNNTKKCSYTNWFKPGEDEPSKGDERARLWNKGQYDNAGWAGAGEAETYGRVCQKNATCQNNSLNKCWNYTINFNKTNYSDAEKKCKEEDNATLASICNQEEEKHIIKLLTHTHKKKTFDLWIGYKCTSSNHECKNNTKKNWHWSDGRQCNYTNWLKKSNWPAEGDKTTLVYSSGKGAWFRFYSSVTRDGYICQIETKKLPEDTVTSEKSNIIHTTITESYQTSEDTSTKNNDTTPNRTAIVTSITASVLFGVALLILGLIFAWKRKKSAHISNYDHNRKYLPDLVQLQKINPFQKACKGEEHHIEEETCFSSNQGGKQTNPIALRGHPNLRNRQRGGRMQQPGRGQHPNMRGQHPNMRGQHPNMRGQEPNMRGQPLNMRGQPLNMRGQPPNMRGQPPNMRGQPLNMRGQPLNMRGQPPNMRGQPSNLRGQPPSMRGQPPNMRGQPLNMRGQPPNIRGQPLNMRGQPPNMRGQHPNMRGQHSNMRGQNLNKRGLLRGNYPNFGQRDPRMLVDQNNTTNQGKIIPAVPKATLLKPPEDSTHKHTLDELKNKLEELLQEEKITAEYKSISPDAGLPRTAGKDPKNIQKNRFQNVFPYDHNRVKLLGRDEDYINASLIDASKPRAFIASQGPKADGLQDFWQMLWQERVNVIIMVTGLVENKQRKCNQYWPDEQKIAKFDDILVRCVISDHQKNFSARCLVAKKGRETRKIWHFQFHAWPDQGVPQFPNVLLSFWAKVKSAIKVSRFPIVVHCSAGIGRTGTFIALDMLLDETIVFKAVDIHRCITNLRKQRPYMVQNIEQYKFLYKALNEWVTAGLTLMDCQHFLQIFPTLFQPKGNDLAKAVAQYQYICQMSKKQTVINPQATSEENSIKNRTLKILPEPKYSVKLKTQEPGKNNYINAIYLDGHAMPNSLIATQSPLEKTKLDFWKMVYENSCSVIVSLLPAEKMQAEEIYFPQDKGDSMDLAPFTIECKNRMGGTDIAVRHLALKLAGKERVIQHLCLNQPLLPKTAAPLMCQLYYFTKRWLHMFPKTRAVVHCLDGSSWTGVFCAALVALDRITSEKSFDMMEIVQTLKLRRETFIGNQTQYNLLFHLVHCFLSRSKKVGPPG